MNSSSDTNSLIMCVTSWIPNDLYFLGNINESMSLKKPMNVKFPFLSIGITSKKSLALMFIVFSSTTFPLPSIMGRPTKLPYETPHKMFGLNSVSSTRLVADIRPLPAVEPPLIPSIRFPIYKSLYINNEKKNFFLVHKIKIDMVIDRKTQQPISVTSKILTLQDKRGSYNIPLGTITSVIYDNEGDSVTFSIQGDESTTYTIHRTDPFGNALEVDASARDLAIRIITLLDT